MKKLTKKCLSLVTITLGVTLFSTQAYADSSYQVQWGDVLSKISKEHNVSIDALVEANASIKNPDIIFAGQMITIPDSKKEETFRVTAYTAGYESTGKSPGDPGYGITASGTKVEEGRTLSCPPSFAFGTEVYIPYFDDTFTCEDRGGAITEGRMDVYMEDLEDALDFGVRDLKVHY
ncbi:LysM peptidoglycan-binding domain-containing protein [Salirhabdus sp. Marseille-P4669]|uniref:LysM peptidoglycan-binding domain-containing protein n=1 Tax=Salirhabdus sp. Marseille-P4669 TaxID=2042310 RepID=UPI000C7CAF9C|nr:LysM peptidoglycan-binding domain-containing protein [Salirhabdus sp. Marseille-P4669]